MSLNDFVHLHVHTEYSLNDALAKVKSLTKKAKELNMKSIAITDHGNMFGVVRFYKEAVKQGIKPIIGCEMYVCPPGKEVKVRDNRHIVLLAKDNVGYKNLINIMSDAAVNGFYYNARTDYDTLRKYSEGLICLTACLGGDLAKTIELEGYEAGLAKLSLYVDIFGADNIYIEVQDNGMEEQYEMNKKLIRMSRETGIPLVATNDVHYIERKDAFYHDALMALQSKTTVDDTKNRKVYGSDEFYLKSYDEMNTGKLPIEAIENTVIIADRCNVTIEFGKYHIPKFEAPAPFADSEAFLRHLAYNGMKERYSDYEERKQELHERLEYELGVIKQMGYNDYFLIMWDFVRYARENDIWCGPGRGSAAGSVLSYCLYIVDVEPLEYHLIFERFLNPSRVSMPDIDWDIPDDKRHIMIQYAINKYGQSSVCQIITFGTYAARGAVRAAGRAFGTKVIPYMDVDKIAKAIPMQLGITIEEAMDINKELGSWYETNETTRNLLDLAMAIEGLPSHTSTHAAGILITPEATTEYVPLWVNDGSVVAQWDMTTLEEVGLLKMDFLGLKTLSVIYNTCQFVYQNRGIQIDRQDLIKFVYDPNSYVLIRKGYTQGIFQLEGAGATAIAKDMQPMDINEASALSSLNRPGPAQYIPTYIQNKRDPRKVHYRFESLRPILESTYGVIVYQEQVMLAVQILAGYSMANADEIRRAMGKKKLEVIAEHRQYFIYGKKDKDGKVVIPGALSKGYDEKELNEFYDEIVDFAKYAFNKSHSDAYTFITAQTGGLKYYYPVEFMASLMTSVTGETSKVAFYIKHCEDDLNIEVLPPDVNAGQNGFVPTKDNKIIYSLSAIKNVGDKAVDNIVVERARNGKFKSFTDFVDRCVDHIDRQMLESLIKAGAFDFTGKARAQLMTIIDETITQAKKNRDKYKYGQMPLLIDPVDIVDYVPKIQEYPKRILLNLEKASLGIYLDGHPLQLIKGYANKNSTISCIDLATNEDESIENSGESVKYYEGQRVSIVCVISKVKQHTAKTSKQQMAFVTIEDTTGVAEVTVFPSLYDTVKDVLVEDKIVHLQGKINIWNGAPKIIANNILEVNINTSKAKLYVMAKNMQELETVIASIYKNSGDIPVCVINGNWSMLLSKKYWTNEQGIRTLNKNNIMTMLRED